MADEPPGQPVRFRPEARSEALEAFDWYDARDPDVADRFDKRLREAVLQIGRHPHLFPHYPGHRVARFLRLKGFPYLVIYRELDHECEVVAVAHARRQPRYWDPRLGSKRDR
jgi:plasmid stabilization system protein ParE